MALKFGDSGRWKKKTIENPRHRCAGILESKTSAFNPDTEHIIPVLDLI